MVLKLTKKLFEQTKKEMTSLNDEYEGMVESNRYKSTEIRNSINKKSNEFNKNRENRSKHFDFIRKK